MFFSPDKELLDDNCLTRPDEISGGFAVDERHAERSHDAKTRATRDPPQLGNRATVRFGLHPVDSRDVSFSASDRDARSSKFKGAAGRTQTARSDAALLRAQHRAERSRRPLPLAYQPVVAFS